MLDAGLDFSALQALALSDDFTASARRFWKWADVALRAPATGGNIEFLMGALLAPARDSQVATKRLGQICLAIGKKVEDCFHKSRQHHVGADASETADVQETTWIGINDLEGGYHLDHHLFRCTLCGRTATERIRTYGIITDSHDACGHKLQNIVFGLPTSQRILGLPQVVQCGLCSWNNVWNLGVRRAEKFMGPIWPQTGGRHTNFKP